MAHENFTNNAEAELTEAIDSNATVIALSTGDFKGDNGDSGAFQRATLTHPSKPGEYEVVHLLSAASGAGWSGFNVRRGAELFSKNPQEWPVGTKVSARVTAGMLDSLTAVTRANDTQRPPLETRYGNFFLNAEAPHSNGERAYSHRIQLGGFEVVSHTPNYLRPDAYSVETAPAPDVNMGRVVTGASYEVDLGDTAVAAWSSSESYAHKSTVSVTDGSDTYVYTFVAFPGSISSYAVNSPADGEDSSGNIRALDSGGDVVGYWKAVPTADTGVWTVGLPFAVYAMLDEVGFICTSYGGTTAATPPVMRASARPTDGSVVSLADGVSLPSSLGQFEALRIPVSEGRLLNDLVFWINTAAIGGAYKGRFYWKGTLFDSGPG